ncbi:MAG: futalosine hydrolase [Fuerstiella sp.]|nr:futalosine hydrolase [Fuerstiella sp.]
MTRTLILIPTRAEHDVLRPFLNTFSGPGDHVALCGFGLVAAAARTVQLIGETLPDRVILVGLAGAFSDQLQTGSATTFGEVVCFGIGAGSGDAHQTADDMGWNHIDIRPTDGELGAITISDTIALRGSVATDNTIRPCQLLSVTASSGNRNEAAMRSRRFPQAVAEDMEGFGVALACQLAQVPLEIVRGISNQVGDRNVSNWQIESALQAAAQIVLQLKSTR